MAHTVNTSDRETVLSLIHDFSIEMTGKDLDGLLAAGGLLPRGTRVNITYLAGETTEMRVDAAKAALELGFVPVPHIPARRLGSRDELEEFLGRMQEVGATERVFVVGGDPAQAEGPFDSALSVITTGLLEQYGVREVGIAGYPEGHPDIATDTLWAHLEAKTAEISARGFESVIVTQFGFDADRVVEWIGDARRRGIHTPIRVGTPGPAGIKRLLGYARRFGIGANAMIVKKFGFSLTNLMGTAGPDRFVDDLATTLRREQLSNGLTLHLYAFGGLEATAQWAEKFARSLGGE